MGSTLAPFVALHDAVDGAKRVHSDCDESASTHRFRLSLWAGEAASEGVSPYPQITGSLQTEVIHLPGFGRPESVGRFADGNVSRLVFSVSLAEPRSSKVTDVTFVTQTVVAGLHYRNNYLHGATSIATRCCLVCSWVLNTRATATAQTRRAIAFFCSICRRSPCATTVIRASSVGSTLDAGGSFGGADALALPRAQKSGTALDIPTVAQGEGYDHVAGITMSPRVRLDLGPTEIGLDVRSDRLLAWRALDGGRSGGVSQTPIGEFRRRASLWMSFGAPWVERFLLSVSWTNRTGTVGDVHVSKNELSLNVGAELAP